MTPRERRFISNLERATGQPIEPMEVPGNAAINQGRLDRLHQRLSDAVSGNALRGGIRLLKELIQRIGTERDITPEQMAYAALNLAIGPEPLLRQQGDDEWIQNNRRRERDRKNGDRRGDRPSRPPEDSMQRYRVEVGHRDRVKPGNLVGAIAGETGLQGRMIGRIQIFEDHSFVDLPKGMPENIFSNLQRLKVMNKQLQITQAK